MKRPRFSHGVVTLAALDLRRRPDHRSELASQLLMGEVVRMKAASRDGQWWRVENRDDGYPGWARAWGLRAVSGPRARLWERRARARVARAYAEARERPGAGALLSPLFWNSRLIPGRGRGRFRSVELPDGRRGWVERAALAVGGTGRRTLLDRVRMLLGVPYLWGGRTPMGMDCSAFTQQVLLEQGIRLPRDSHEQYRACRPLRRAEEPRLGDLVFFGPRNRRMGHVALALGGGYFAHSRGHVKIQSMDLRNPLCDKGLLRQFRGYGRPRSRVRGVVRGRESA